MTSLRIISTVIALTLICPGAARAGGIPVIDVANVAESIRQLVQMQQAYQRQFEELQQSIKQVEALTGSRGMGDLLNSPAFRDSRRYTPTTWEDTLRILEAGGLPGSAADTRAIYETHAETFQVGSGADIDRRDETSPNALAHERRRDTAYASMAVAERSFDEASQRTVNYESLMARIDASPDSKASTDLNARVVAENGMALNDLVRLSTIQLQQQAAADNQALVDATNMAAMLRYQTFRLEDIPTE